jgi:hypothetical protein
MPKNSVYPGAIYMGKLIDDNDFLQSQFDDLEFALKFQNNPNSYTFKDNLEVVPEPGTLLIFGLFFFGIGIRMTRKI